MVQEYNQNEGFAGLVAVSNTVESVPIADFNVVRFSFNTCDKDLRTMVKEVLQQQRRVNMLIMMMQPKMIKIMIM